MSSQRWLAHLGQTGLSVLVAALLALPLTAQEPRAVGGRGEIFVGSELENYLRLLQVGGQSALYPWSIRAFSPGQVERLLPRDALHPWAGRYALAPDTAGGFRFDWIYPQADFRFNSAFPYGANNGAVWAGRGLTTAVQAGFAARYGPLSLTVAPVAFRAENASFELVANGHQGPRAFGDWRLYGYQIDLPQRFGDEPYARVDPGQTTLRLDLLGLALGVSTANQHWGPAFEHPIVLGNNAPGFLHVFAGTSHPWNIGIGSLHGRVVWGRLEQSLYSPAPDSLAARFMSGMVATFSPRGIPGLEVGGGRFFHSHWPTAGIGWQELSHPFDWPFKGTPDDDSLPPSVRDSLYYNLDNQIASLFLRWVFPESGFEVYGEYGKEDHNVGLRHLALHFDHMAGYLLGLRKVWMRSPGSLISLRGELLNLQVQHLWRLTINQSPFYQHHHFTQGHTHRGQILGSAAGYGGAASTVAVDYYHPRGRWTLSWEREIRADQGGHWNSGIAEPRGLDVTHALAAEALFFRGRWDVLAGVAGVYNLNRNFQGDAFNLNTVLRVRVAP